MAEEKKDEEFRTKTDEEKVCEESENDLDSVSGPETDSEPEESEDGNEENVDDSSSEESENGSAELKKEEEDLQTQFLRLNADFQNYRRRSESEKADIYAYANEKIILQILDVIDNFDRAMAAAPQNDKFAEGMQLILKQLKDLLEKNNVVEIDALGKDFDPNFHNAVMTEAAEESGKVTKVLQKGYMLNSKVIRPAMVAVSQ